MNLREKARKCMRAVESDSVKSARKAKDKLHKACERASEIRERTLHRQAHGKHESHETLIDSSQHTSMHCCAEGLALQCLSLYFWFCSMNLETAVIVVI